VRPTEKAIWPRVDATVESNCLDAGDAITVEAAITTILRVGRPRNRVSFPAVKIDTLLFSTAFILALGFIYPSIQGDRPRW
jgi:hypothetical protein